MLPTHRPPTHPDEMLLKEVLEPLEVSRMKAASRMNIAGTRFKGRGGHALRVEHQLSPCSSTRPRRSVQGKARTRLKCRPLYTQGTRHVPVPVSVIEYDADGTEATLGTTVSVRREPVTDPENCAGGPGSIEIGPASIR
jgi:hypothetical protein